MTEESCTDYRLGDLCPICGAPVGEPCQQPGTSGVGTFSYTGRAWSGGTYGNDPPVYSCHPARRMLDPLRLAVKRALTQ